jgi:hypothetical protein
MHLVGVHQELRIVVVHGEREMVRNGLVHVEPRRPAESAGEIDAFLVEGQVCARFLGQAGHTHDGSYRLGGLVQSERSPL